MLPAAQLAPHTLAPLLRRRLLVAVPAAAAAARAPMPSQQRQAATAAGFHSSSSNSSSNSSSHRRRRPRPARALSPGAGAGAGAGISVAPRRGMAAAAAAASSSASSSSSSSSAGMNRAQELFYAQLGFKTIVRDRLAAAKNEIRTGLGPKGEGYVVLRDFLRNAAPGEGGQAADRLCRNMRSEALALFKAGLFYSSFAYRGEERVDKKNVYNYELEGFEWDYAPSLLMYTREIMLHVPALLNELFPDQLRISPRAYANKIAVSTGGGSHYLKHTDNNSPEADQRKATLVYYLNPGWDSKSNGGQLRLYSRSGKQVAVPPEGDTLVLFLSDELEHEVLPNHDEREEHHRITYTLWLVQEGKAGGGKQGDA